MLGLLSRGLFEEDCTANLRPSQFWLGWLPCQWNYTHRGWSQHWPVIRLGCTYDTRPRSWLGGRLADSFLLGRYRPASTEWLDFSVH